MARYNALKDIKIKNTKAIKSNLKLRRRRKSRKGRRGGRRRGGMHYVEIFPISVTLGESVALTLSLLSNRPKGSNFRIQYIHFVGTTCYDVSNATNQPGYYAPSAIQITCQDANDGSIVATTGPVVLGCNPRNIKVNTPKQEDWIAYNADEKTVFGKIEAVCLGKPSTVEGQKQFIRGIVHVFVKFGSELVTAACPALKDWANKKLVQSDDSSGLSEEFVSLCADMNN